MENYRRGRKLAQTINLLDAINKQKNHDLIVFTTFTFDPIFFDGYILRKLKRNNPNAVIIVLMDADNYSVLQNDFTKETGVEYALIPVSGNLFHSKIFIFASKTKNHVFVGSHNLTHSGLTQNLELCLGSDEKELVQESIAYVHSLLKNNVDAKNPWNVKVESHLENELEKNQLITNQDKPILKQCLEIVSKKDKIKEVSIFSPYFSKINEILHEINKTNPEKIRLCIQKNNHNLDISNLEKFENLSLSEVKTIESRRMHAKFIAFRGTGEDLILVGSPNTTGPALLKTSNEGNFESAIIVEEDFDKIFSEIKIKDISKEEIEDSKRVFQDKEEKRKNPEIIIKFAYLDDFNKLNVEYEAKSSKTVEIEFYTIDDSKISESLDLDHKENLITISPPENAVEFCLTEDNNRISNLIRICNPKDMKKRTGFLLDDSKSVQKSLNEVVDFEDIANFCFSLFSSDVEKIGEPSNHPIDSVPSLGKRKSSKTSSGIIDLLNKLFRLSVSKTPKDSQKSEEYQKSSKRQKEIDEILADLIKRLISKFERDVIPKTNFTKRYSAYLVISLKLLKKFSEGQIRGISSVRAISGLNQMMSQDQDFENLEESEKNEILYLLSNLAKEANVNLKSIYKFDEESILRGLNTLVLKHFSSQNPIQSIIEELEKSPKYGLTEKISGEYENILKEILQQVFIRLSDNEKLDYCKSLIQQLDKESDFKIISLGYEKLKLFLEKDSGLRGKIIQESKFLENHQNADAVNRIISEFQR